MDLKRNLLDNIKECEMKIGYCEEEIGLYYPLSSLLELLATDEAHLKDAIEDFVERNQKELGEVVIAETTEKGRYCITVPAKGVRFVHEHVQESPFLKAFISEIQKPRNTLEKILETFHQFSEDICVEEEKEHEWAVSFADGEMDPYIYHIEEDAFGLEYHRFTKDAYEFLKTVDIDS